MLHTYVRTYLRACLCSCPCMPDTCTCPRLWSEFSGALLDRIPVIVSFCRAPKYVKTPCQCLDGCQVRVCLAVQVCLAVSVSSYACIYTIHTLCKAFQMMTYQWRENMMSTSWIQNKIVTSWHNNMTTWHYQCKNIILTMWRTLMITWQHYGWQKHSDKEGMCKYV